MSRWWIDEPVFVGSSNPTDDELKDLFESGFRTIISLLDERQERHGGRVLKLDKSGEAALIFNDETPDMHYQQDNCHACAHLTPKAV